MDGVLVNNTRAHVRAFEIFCKRYGVEEWQRKLQTSFGMGNDDIMRQILPEEIIREKGLKALGEEKEAIYREVYAPEIRPVREGRVYNNNRRTNPSGGNDYWESGVIHPDLILQDLIRIFHPELTDAEPTYYRKLN